MRYVNRAVLAGAAIALFTAASAAATSAAAQAAVITGPGTSLTFSGTGGDYITQDQSWSYDPSNSVINASVSTDGNTVTISVSGDTFWDLDFAAPQGQALTAGTVYDNAARWPFESPTQPGLSLSGDGRGCNTLTGSFTVLSATFGPHGWITSFDATFVQHCEGDPNSAATGEVVLNNGPAPPDLSVTVAASATDTVSHTSGRATLTGTVTCNRAATVDVSGTLNQRLTRTVLATGNWSVNGIACSTTPTQWSATVTPTGNIPFGPGKAEVDGSFQTFDSLFQTFVSGSFSQAVKLVNG